MIPALQAMINFLSAQTTPKPNATTETWPDGPTVEFRSVRTVSLDDYVSLIKKVELWSASKGESQKEMVQRIRRLYFSKFTEVTAEQGGTPYVNQTPRKADDAISGITPLDTPPFRTTDIDLSTLNGLCGTRTIVTKRGLEVDISHFWIALDASLNGTDVRLRLLDTEPIPLFTWVGDLASAMRDTLMYAKAAVKRAEIQPTHPFLNVLLNKIVKDKCSKGDLLGDIDAVVLCNYLKSLSSFVLSDEIHRYYDQDDKPQTQLTSPNSARRFHWFVNLSTEPTIPTVEEKQTLPVTTPVQLSLKKDVFITDLKDMIIEAVADISMRSNGTIEDEVDDYASKELAELQAEFAQFIDAGLKNGDAEWPPKKWE